MKNRIFNLLKFKALILIVISAIVGAYFLNRYLENEKLFIYKTGSDKKAIYNSTWNMSLKEVERVSNKTLKDGVTFAVLESGLNSLLDLERITAKKIDPINLWTENAELTYEFFDDRLFRYRLLGQIYNPKVFDSVAIKNLELSYGKIIKDTTKFDGKFLKDSVSVDYSQFDIENNEKKIEHRFLIEVTYLPIFNEIIKTAKKEQKSIFN